MKAIHQIQQGREDRRHMVALPSPSLQCRHPPFLLVDTPSRSQIAQGRGRIGHRRRDNEHARWDIIRKIGWPGMR